MSRAPDNYRVCAAISCGKVFKAYRVNHRFCSPVCGARQRYTRNQAATPLVRVCANVRCHVEFIPKPNQKFCSPQCARREGVRRYRRTPAGRAANNRYSRKWREQNKGYVSRMNRKYYHEHREELLAWQRQYRKKEAA